MMSADKVLPTWRRCIQSFLFVSVIIQFALHAQDKTLVAQAQENSSQPDVPQINVSQNNAQDQAQHLLRNYFDTVLELQDVYGPDLVTVEDATAKYPILAKSSFSCPFTYEAVPQTQTQCFTPIITVYDRISNSLEEWNESSIPVPEVLLISGLDAAQDMDLMGPSSIYATLNLLLESAQCESLSPWIVGNGTSEAIQCRQRLKSQGIDDSLRKWMARLVVTRRIVAVPIADVTEFYNRLVGELISSDGDVLQNDQFENEAKCDFPFPLQWSSENGDGKSSTNCMGTYPSQIIYELFRSHSFQLGVSFHGSSSGSTGLIEIPHWNSKYMSSSEEEAMTKIGSAMSIFGSGIDTLRYEVTTINPTSVNSTQSVNECTGATMENWAFSAGFSSANSEIGGDVLLQQCSCESVADGDCEYPSDRTKSYDGPSLRSFVARVVAPPSLGPNVHCLPGFGKTINHCDNPPNQHAMFDHTPLGINTRLSLFAIDLVQPYTAINSIAGVEIKDDIVPLSPRLAESCTRTKAMRLPESSSTNNITVTWTVGGALTVEETAVMYGEWNVLDKKIFNCAAQPTKQELDTFFSILRDFEQMEGETEEQMEAEVTFTPVQSGTTRWYSSDQEKENPETTFSVTLDLSRYKVGDVIALYTLARVDQDWLLHGHSEDNNYPQSNLVNARTNPDWIISMNEFDSLQRRYTIKGQLDFFSVPVTIEIEEHPGFFESTNIAESSVRLSDVAFVEQEIETDGIILYLVMAVLTIIVVFICTFCRENSDGTDIFSVLSARRKIMHVSCAHTFTSTYFNLTT